MPKESDPSGFKAAIDAIVQERQAADPDGFFAAIEQIKSARSSPNQVKPNLGESQFERDIRRFVAEGIDGRKVVR